MKQYVPLKPTKRGFKVWVRADAVTGFFCDFNVYVGRQESSDGDSREVGLGERVVHELCTPLHGGNYQVFCDNFFTTCSLFEDLLKQKIYACGTARMDRRGFPETLKGVVLPERGQHVSCQRGNLVATIWQDKKAVKVLSTMSDPVQSKSCFFPLLSPRVALFSAFSILGLERLHVFGCYEPSPSRAIVTEPIIAHYHHLWQQINKSK